MDELSGLINERIEGLRRKLHDTSRRNPLINNVLSARSAAFIRIVDEKPQSIFDQLVIDEETMVLSPLPPVNIDPPDESTSEFKTAFLNAQSTDEEYISSIEKIDYEADENALNKQEDAERALKDRVREDLELPPRPKSEQFSDLINHAKSHGIDPSTALPLPTAISDDGRFEDEELQTLLLPKTFQSRLGRILSKARMYQEERGLDVAYIVLGYLKWTLPNAEKGDEFKSPILLIPVKLEKRKSIEGEKYLITKLSDPMFNPSLGHKLHVDADLDLSDLKRQAEQDHIDVEHLFEEMASLKPKNMQWSVLREATFGIYPFQGIELYNDLDTNLSDFSDFPIVKELMVGRETSPDLNTSDFTESDVESSQGQQLVPHIVLDADSSQFISLLKVANEENVALEGPPGSGKSQTIVNAIANAIYSGKKVLFVAQKVTALEVVLSRLQSLGLNDFVLPLMGGHGSTDEFYKAVERRLDRECSFASRDIDNLKRQFESERDKLADYIEILKEPVSGTGMTVHQVVGLAIKNSKAISSLPLELRRIQIYPDRLVKGFGPSDIDAMASQVAKWCTRLADLEIARGSPWADIPANTLNTDTINQALVNAGRGIIEVRTKISGLHGRSRELLEQYLENTLERIQHHLDDIADDYNLNRAHRISFKLGKEQAAQELSNLAELCAKISKLRSKFGLEEGQLNRVGSYHESLKDLADFGSKFDFENINQGDVDSKEKELCNQIDSLSELNSLKKKLVEKISDKTSPGDILSYEILLSHQKTIQEFEPYLRIVSIDKAKIEIENTRSLVRRFKHIFSVDSLPSTRELNSLQTTITKAGIFSFLSANYKSSMQEASRLLVNDGTKTSALDSLINAKEFISDWDSLEISSYIKISDPALPDQLSQLSSALDALETFKSMFPIPFFNALQFLKIDQLDKIINLIKQSGGTKLSWDAVPKKISKAEKRAAKIRANKDVLTDAERLFSSLGFSRLSDLKKLVSDCANVSHLLERKQALKSLLGMDAFDDESINAVLEAHHRYSSLSDFEVSLLFSDEGSEALAAIRELLPKLMAIQESFVSLSDAKNQKIASDSVGISEILSIIEEHRADQVGLNNLISRRTIFAEAELAGLADLVYKIQKIAPTENLTETTKAAIAASLQDQVQGEFGSFLMQFDGMSLDAARSRIQNLDRKIIEVSKHEISDEAISVASPPYGNSYGKKSEYTELALLNHELQKQRRTPPRKVLRRARQALMELFPCWMMVPTAVAQHLPRRTDFDLVIIDEASQMPPESSISALMRGRNALIAGDTNQLPPTNFFKGLSVDEDEDEDLATTEESILELANVQFHPKHRLLWHYRSRHEDLIAFSNHYVYDSELVIFPSPHPTMDGMGISLIEVNGTFQRGINPAEAQVMLDAIVQFMKDTPKRSLGVAVMNQAQMEQLEAMVLREADSNASVAEYLDYWANERQGLERFFVKNLENVQGDERDVIFVGTVYGREPSGKFYQRFGPINGPAGKRRLNVLFSRAKEQIVTFSSIPLSDFNPSPTNEGATLLRRWLEFSATKRLGEVAHDHGRAGHTDSPFEDHVIEVVESLGYKAVPQVGVSSYFIDIGVQHPSYPLGYICGIECDGASYHSSKSARDRDRLREEVLNRLGWELHRIWSTDWFRDPQACKNVLKDYLAKRLEMLVQTMPEPVEPADSHSPSDQQPLECIHNENGETLPTASKNARDGLDKDAISVGTNFSIRYLNGPRAGVLAKFCFQKTTSARQGEQDGYKPISRESPLGAALEGAHLEEIVTFMLRDQEIRAQIINIEK